MGPSPEVHAFRFRDARLLLDVATGAVFELDGEGWDAALALWGPGVEDRAGAGRGGPGSTREFLREVTGLRRAGMLPDRGSAGAGLPGAGGREGAAGRESAAGREGAAGRVPARALCLNVSHDCNLRCSYCFAGGGRFDGPRELMSRRVAGAAIDFLFDQGHPGGAVEVDFFGGEPLLNVEVVEDAVRYGRALARRRGKRILFTLTTNAVGMTDDIALFLAREMDNVVLSLDGRPGVHDGLRPLAGASGGGDGRRGSYRAALEGIRRFQRARESAARGQGAGGPRTYYIRGTFTRLNLDFSRDVLHLADLGFPEISVEPVVSPGASGGAPGGAGHGASYALGPAEVPAIEEEYERLALAMLEREADGRGFSFFHFNVDPAGGPCLPRRVRGCGAGGEYLAVVPSGEVYPCHQFVGREGFVMGDVFSGLHEGSRGAELGGVTLFSKRGCPACWARYFCGGGCHANAHRACGDPLVPDPVGCAMLKKRVECALYLASRRAAPSRDGP